VVALNPWLTKTIFTEAFHFHADFMRLLSTLDVGNGNVAIYVKCPNCGGEFRTQVQLDRREEYLKGSYEALEICRYCDTNVKIAPDTTYWLNE
jgi:antirestriction protein